MSGRCFVATARANASGPRGKPSSSSRATDSPSIGRAARALPSESSNAAPIGVLPLADGRCQVVWTVPHQQAEELRDLPVSEFLKELEHCTGGLLGKLELDSQRWLFPVKLMQSNQYIAPRLALIGDAAHCCHPVAGQGMNLGIRDAVALAEVLISAHQAGDLVTADVEAGLARRGGELATPVDRVVPFPQHRQRRADLGVTHCPC